MQIAQVGTKINFNKKNSRPLETSKSRENFGIFFIINLFLKMLDSNEKKNLNLFKFALICLPQNVFAVCERI